MTRKVTSQNFVYQWLAFNLDHSFPKTERCHFANNVVMSCIYLLFLEYAFLRLNSSCSFQKDCNKIQALCQLCPELNPASPRILSNRAQTITFTPIIIEMVPAYQVTKWFKILFMTLTLTQLQGVGYFHQHLFILCFRYQNQIFKSSA